MHAFERDLREPLSTSWDFEIAVVDLAPLSPPWIKQRRVDVGHARRVRVSLDCNIHATLARGIDQFETDQALFQTRAVDMYHVCGCTCYGCRGYHLQDGLNTGPGFDSACASDVNEHW